MALIQVGCDELYPYYSLQNYGDISEISDNDLAFIKQVFTQFDRVQKILEAFYNADEDRCRKEETD